MIIKVTLFITIVLHAFIANQSFFYMLGCPRRLKKCRLLFILK